MDQGVQPTICETRKAIFTVLRALEDISYRPALRCSVELCFYLKEVNFFECSSTFVYSAIDKALQSDPSNLIDCRNWRPLLRGNEIIKYIAIDRSEIKSALTKIMYLQVEKPEISIDDVIRLAQQNPAYFTAEMACE